MGRISKVAASAVASMALLCGLGGAVLAAVPAGATAAAADGPAGTAVVCNATAIEYGTTAGCATSDATAIEYGTSIAPAVVWHG